MSVRVEKQEVGMGGAPFAMLLLPSLDVPGSRLILGSTWGHATIHHGIVRTHFEAVMVIVS